MIYAGSARYRFAVLGDQTLRYGLALPLPILFPHCCLVADHVFADSVDDYIRAQLNLR